MEKKFKETRIPEDFSKAVSQNHLIISPPYVYRIVTVLFDATSRILASSINDIKDGKNSVAVVFKDVYGKFIAAAKLEYEKNEDKTDDESAGSFDYSWTFYEDDIKDSQTIDAVSNSLVSLAFTGSGSALYGMGFKSESVCILLMNLSLEFIKQWLMENTTETEPATVTLNGVFKATGKYSDGKIELGIYPDGAMKTLIKNDRAIQSAK